jgi:hypothetical protein
MENYQWCGESCFAGAAISIDGYLPQIPRRGLNQFAITTGYVVWDLTTKKTTILLSRERTTKKTTVPIVVDAQQQLFTTVVPFPLTDVYSSGFTILIYYF